MNENRKRLELLYGPEVVVQCCREWKTHYGNGQIGSCGICRKIPQLIIGKKWDDE